MRRLLTKVSNISERPTHCAADRKTRLEENLRGSMATASSLRQLNRDVAPERGHVAVIRHGDC